MSFALISYLCYDASRKEVPMNSLLEKGSIIPLTFDIMFTEVFNNQNNICILEEFIANYLNIPLPLVEGNLKILSRRLFKENRYDSKKEVDLLLDLNGKKINIEMSNNNSMGVINRNVVYLCKVHGEQLKQSDYNYSHISETIQIMFNNFNSQKELKTTWYLRDEQGNILTNKIRIDIINLVKGKDMCYTYKKDVDYLINWCKLLTESKANNLLNISHKLMSSKSTNVLLKDINKLNGDDEMVRLYTKLSRREMEYNTFIEEAKEKGFNQGKQEGFESGKQEGLKKGLEQGIEQKSNEIAKNMLIEKIPLETISKITGLSIEKIQELKNK